MKILLGISQAYHRWRCKRNPPVLDLGEVIAVDPLSLPSVRCEDVYAALPEDDPHTFQLYAMVLRRVALSEEESIDRAIGIVEAAHRRFVGRDQQVIEVLLKELHKFQRARKNRIMEEMPLSPFEQC